LDHVDVAYFAEVGMPLANTPGQFSSIALAEHALFLMLCFAKSFADSQKGIRAKAFWTPLNEELSGRTLGIIGLGASGRELAKRAWAIGMRVLAINRSAVPKSLIDELHLASVGNWSELDRVLAEADYVSLHVPLVPETHHLIDKHALELMKPTAVLINIARGGLVDEEALMNALRTSQIKGAGLDVFAEEPLPPAHPLLEMDNVVATPHIAGVTEETMRRRAEAAARNVDRVAEGLPPLHQVKHQVAPGRPGGTPG
jgi:phosphoglycerate dehydrogenase-like enzyme